jgi:hypothetical protein
MIDNKLIGYEKRDAHGRMNTVETEQHNRLLVLSPDEMRLL